MHEVLIEESVLGWKEYELELMRDRHDNVVVVCSIENVDPMGVHTGDSVTVAPAMTLTDREYQRLRDLGIAVLREVGVDTGGCNIQFAVNPADGRIVVIEMNPRVSRSSALASKATGFPIAKIAAKLAIGYTLDEIPNDITLKTPAAFEPALDYVVVKIPRFAFEKFPGADPELTTTMKSVGEAMSLGRNFTEALNKAMRSMETTAAGFLDRPDPAGATVENTLAALRMPHDGRLYTVERALRLGASVAEVAEASGGIDPWFLDQIAALVELRAEIVRRAGARRRPAAPGQAGRPVRPAARRAAPGAGGRGRRPHAAAPARASGRSTRRWTPAPPSSRRPRRTTTRRTTRRPRSRRRTGPRCSSWAPGRTGSGRASSSTTPACTRSWRCAAAGYETVMVNCNPETVSTDYDTADRLYFEPLTFEDVLEVWHAEDTSGRAAGGPGVVGVIVQLGGQTPLGLARRLKEAGVPIVGTSPESIHLAEERGAFGARAGPGRAARPGARHRHLVRRGEGDRRRDRLPGAGPAVVRARRPGHGDRLRRRRRCATTSAGRPTSRPTTRCWSTGSSTTPSRSTWTRSATPTARSTSAA